MPLSKLCQSPVKPLSNFLTAFWQCAELGFRARPPVKTSTVKTGFDSFWQTLTSFDSFWQRCQKLSKPGLTAFWQGCQNLFDSFWQRFDRAVKTCQSAVLIGFDSFWQLLTALSKRCQKMSKKHFDNNFDSFFDREAVRRPRAEMSTSPPWFLS